MSKLAATTFGILVLVSLSASAAQTISYYEQQLQSVAITAIFYASSIVLLLVFALFNVASRNGFGLWYTLQFMLGLFLVACVDGTASRLLWPGNPELTNWIPLTTLLALNGNGLLLAVAASEGQPPVLMKKLSGSFQIMGIISFVCIALIPVVPIILLALVANILFIPMVLSQLLSAMSWRPSGQHPGERQFAYAGRFSRITGLLFMLAVLVICAVAWHQMSNDTFSYAELSYTAVRLVYALLSFSLVATYMAHIIGIRKDHEDALQRELQTARRAAVISEEKLQAEREFTRMRELAAQRRAKLSEASHDIRQPLVSLRLTLDKLKHAVDLDDDIEYQQALSYIDRLADSFTSTDSDSDNAPIEASASDSQSEVMPLNLLLQTMTQMFAEEAKSKDIQLRTVPTSMQVLVNPVAVMRITSNMVSNAIQHSGSQRILIACRRDGSRVRIEVCDQGSGVSAEQFEQLKQRGVKGGASTGQGVGLASCFELAEQNHYPFGVRRSPLIASCFFLSVPRHPGKPR